MTQLRKSAPASRRPRHSPTASRAAPGVSLRKMSVRAQSSAAVQRLVQLRARAGAVAQREDDDAISVTSYTSGWLSNGPFFEHIRFSDGSYWSTKIAASNGRHVYLDIRAGLHKGEGYSVRDADGYKAGEVRSWLIGRHADLADHWRAYRAAATK
ncbi:hypothetical protein [uncultured Roseobacter sp.]|uniref:hypothetical protein n=1 Tax=uncultured Roseobacter sp. TaxID=114847 RepID=UPI002636B4F9|nr:hypothetical protein [uncultured Roseobacter sp.]